ncbi:MAG: alkyl hydroperoxide reductase subunit F [Spongiibacteraceae bacterium]
MLDTNLRNQLKGYLEKLAAPIEILAAVNESADAKSTELLALLDDIASLSNLITLRRDDSAERKPSFRVTRVGESSGVQFAGIPLGHEFTSLVLALLQTSGYPAKVDAQVIEQIRNLPANKGAGTYTFETFISLSCQNCPDVVQALNLMAIINPNISHTMIDGALFQKEVEARQILSVPSVYLNGELFGQGRMSIEEILAKLDTGAAARATQQLSEKEVFDSLIVGGGPAGAAAAIYSARKGINTGVVAERFGGHVLDTMAIENFISVQETEGPKLAMALEQHVKSYDVDIMNLQRAQKLVPAAESASGLIEIELESGAVLRSKSVVIATGARWREMNVPGEREYRGRGVAYCPHCDGPLFKGKAVAVIGGGNSGVEAAIDLAGIVSHVTLLEFDVKLRADAVLQRKLFSLPNVTVITSALSTEVTGDGKKVNGLTYIDRNSMDRSGGTEHHIELAGIFVQIGLLPNTDWLKGSVALSPRGEIEIDARGQTSVPGVFAAGDVTTVPFKQIVIAMGEGAKAALGAFDHLIRSPAVKADNALAEVAAIA